jgi:tripartite-type tricarboxylate transporter receptor subunit TctC
MQRRHLIAGAAALAAALAAPAALAQTWPNRPIRIVQGFAPGGNADSIARVIGTEIGKSLGQPIVVEGRPGAGGNLASDAVAKATPDGYTLVLLTGGHTVSGALYKSLPFDPAESFEMVSTITQFPFLFTVKADSPYPTLRALIEAARAKPESVGYGTAGIGSTHHLTGELLAKMAGAPLLHIPYKGDAAAITAQLGGEIPLVVATPTVAVAQVKAGKLKVLATSGNTRWAGMPDVPTADEAGVPEFDVRSWVGLAAPAGTPRAIIERLNAEVQRAIQVPEVKARLEAFGGEAKGSTPQEMKERVVFEVARWKKVIADAKIPQQ